MTLKNIELTNSSEVVISLRNVSKTFNTANENNSTIRERVRNFVSSTSTISTVSALKNISFNVHRGETLGIIGRNGSGKSTLIRLIMKSLRPDNAGEINTKGKIIRLALGMGFDPNLSARDNIYVNGSILGLSFKYIGNIFHEIIEFAGLEAFIDTPVKHYSNGMKQRLTFSIAIHADADIFLLDEFFGGTGDEDFKKKSDEAFKNQIIGNNTVVMVSHSLQNIKQYCKRCIWIDKGAIKMIGDSHEVVNNYRSSFKVST